MTNGIIRRFGTPGIIHHPVFTVRLGLGLGLGLGGDLFPERPEI